MKMPWEAGYFQGFKLPYRADRYQLGPMVPGDTMQASSKAFVKSVMDEVRKPRDEWSPDLRRFMEALEELGRLADETDTEEEK